MNCLPDDAIVNLKLQGGYRQEILEELHAETLRGLIKPSMNLNITSIDMY